LNSERATVGHGRRRPSAPGRTGRDSDQSLGHQEV